MKAFRLLEYGKPGEFVDVPEPVIKPGHVILRTQAAGICASDVHFQSPDFTPSIIQQQLWKLPITLGHEIAGEIVEVGAGVFGWQTGDPVLVGMGGGCGFCWQCTHQYGLCQNMIPIFPGLGYDGGLAPYVQIAQENLVRRSNLSAELAAPLPDAGATAYHAVSFARDVLIPGEAVAVIGTGGLGHFAVAILSTITNCRIIAIDVREEGLDLARRMGAHDTVLSNSKTAEEVRRLVPAKCAAVLDFAGLPVTTSLATQIVAPGGEIVLVGMADGTVAIDRNQIPAGVRTRFAFGSTRRDILDVLQLAQAGLIRSEIAPFPFEDTPLMYQKLANGELVGRGVAVFS